MNFKKNIGNVIFHKGEFYLEKDSNSKVYTKYEIFFGKTYRKTYKESKRKVVSTICNLCTPRDFKIIFYLVLTSDKLGEIAKIQLQESCVINDKEYFKIRVIEQKIANFDILSKIIIKDE